MSVYKLNNTIKVKEYLERKKEFQRTDEYGEDNNSNDKDKMLYGSLLLEKNTVDEIKFATKELWRILKTVKEAMVEFEDEELIRMGYPDNLVSFMKIDYLNCYNPLSRFDFIIGDNGIKTIGLNTVSPSLVKETLQTNRQMVNYENSRSKKMIFQKTKSEKTKSEKSKIENPKIENWKNENWKIKISEFIKGKNEKMNFLNSPNENATNIKTSYLEILYEASKYLGILNPMIVVASIPYEEDKENYSQVKFIYDNMPYNYGRIDLLNVKSLSIVDGEGIFKPNGEKIDILIVPVLQHMKFAEDRFFKLVEQKKLALINPPSAYILQNKFSLYFLWNMYLNGTLSEADSEIVEKYLTPTFCTPYGMDKCIRKSVDGSVNFKVEVVDVMDNKRDVYNDSREDVSIYQEFFELPSIEVIINEELQEKKFIITSFVCNDEPIGLACNVKSDNEEKTHWLAVSHI